MTCCAAPISSGSVPGQVDQAARWPALIVALYVAGNSMVVSLAYNTSNLRSHERVLLQTLLLMATLVVVALVGPHLWRGIRQAARQGQAAVEMLFVSGIMGAGLYSVHTMVTGKGPIYFEVISILLLVYALGDKLKAQTQHRVVHALQQAAPTPPDVAVLGPNGALLRRPLAAVALNDEVRVFPGEVIAVDGHVIAGISSVDESALTGEAFWVTKGPGATVLAGSRCLDGTVTVRASCSGPQRHLDAMAQAVKHALTARSPIECLAARVAKKFVALVLTTAGATFVFWLRRRSFEAAFLNAMAVLLVACPCALGFATPVGLWTALVRLARIDVTARSTAAIQRLAATRRVVFDKTGTLTHLQLAATALTLVPNTDISRHKLIAMVQAAQTASQHPIASAFNALPSAPPGHSAPLYVARNVRGLPGAGICVALQGPQGSHSLVLGEPQQVLAPQHKTLYGDLTKHWPLTARHVAIVVDGQLIAAAGLQEVPHCCFGALSTALHRLNIESCILSGDTQARTQALGGAQAKGNMRALDKRDQVNVWGNAGQQVCFVGDGINDAAAMASSAVSVAMADSADLALCTADLVLPQHAPQRIVQAMVIARQSVARVKSNLYIAAVYNLVGMGAAAGGALHPVLAAALMVASSLTVSLRSAQLLHAHLPE